MIQLGTLLKTLTLHEQIFFPPGSDGIILRVACQKLPKNTYILLSEVHFRKWLRWTAKSFWSIFQELYSETIFPIFTLLFYSEYQYMLQLVHTYSRSKIQKDLECLREIQKDPWKIHLAMVHDSVKLFNPYTTDIRISFHLNRSDWQVGETRPVSNWWIIYLC